MIVLSRNVMKKTIYLVSLHGLENVGGLERVNAYLTVITKSFYFYTTDNSESTMHTKFLQNCDSQIAATVCAENLLATHNLLNKETIKALSERKSWCKEQLFKYAHKTFPPRKAFVSRIMHKALFVVLKRLYRWDY